jgi:hypothetical protein
VSQRTSEKGGTAVGGSRVCMRVTVEPMNIMVKTDNPMNVNVG